MSKQKGRFNAAKFAALLSTTDEKGMSRTQFAAALGCSVSSLYSYANGAKEPGFSFVVRLSEVTKTKTDSWVNR